MVLNIAHRGFSAVYPENTLLSFEKALELGVDWLELDLQITADDHLVVMHDATVDRTTDGEGAVSDLTLDQILALDAGISRGESYRDTGVPTFAHVLETLGHRAHIVVELKFEGQEVIPAVLDAITEAGLQNLTVISIFPNSHGSRHSHPMRPSRLYSTPAERPSTNSLPKRSTWVQTRSARAALRSTPIWSPGHTTRASSYVPGDWDAIRERK